LLHFGVPGDRLVPHELAKDRELGDEPHLSGRRFPARLHDLLEHQAGDCDFPRSPNQGTRRNGTRGRHQHGTERDGDQQRDCRRNVRLQALMPPNRGRIADRILGQRASASSARMHAPIRSVVGL
jgi:hypothetical protein